MKTLLFGTTYVDSPDRVRVLELWMKAAMRNRGCDVMIVDSASPMFPHVPLRIRFNSFRDNVGHLSRGGRDGWGRAFCHGLRTAINEGYDYVMHVEGDSLLRLDVDELVDEMELSSDCVATIPVSSMTSWPETGLMLFSVDWLQSSHFIERYDWEKRTKHPEPEVVVRDIVGKDIVHKAWRGMRDDFHELTVDNVLEKNLDWLTHAALPVMAKFAL